MNELALFAGAGGGILGGHILGWRTVCAVEIDPYAASVLLARQNDGILPPFPIWDDICTFDGREWRGLVDVVSGGFPCQDISVAGKGAGLDGERSGLWREMARVVREVEPRFVLVENSPALTSRGLGVVLGDLAALGYDAEWGVLGAEQACWAAGVPAVWHGRDRIWIVAARPDSNGVRQLQPAGGEQCRGGWAGNVGSRESPDADEERRNGRRDLRQRLAKTEWWLTEPDVGRVAHGVAARVDRLAALGNGQVPAVAALAWHVLSTRLGVEA